MVASTRSSALTRTEYDSIKSGRDSNDNPPKLLTPGTARHRIRHIPQDTKLLPGRNADSEAVDSCTGATSRDTGHGWDIGCG
jgi:hypothetical protein